MAETTDAAVGNVVDRIMTLDELRDFIADDEVRFAGLNDAVCTYAEGYIRQEVFSCLTCKAASGEVAGVCYACSLECHDGHDLVELYTKRQFKCDCGNSRFAAGDPCKLEREKSARNQYNKYNDNFSNKWCICKKPYPCEEGTPEADSEMVQCAVCEDWFHTIHLDGSLEQEAEEVICKACVTRLPFLMAYEKYVESDKPTDGSCYLASRQNLTQSEPKTLGFLKSKGFRESLCTCNECKKLYSEKDVEFLTDYEEASTKYRDDRAAVASASEQNDAASEIFNLVNTQYGADVAAEVSQKVSILKSIIRDEFKKVSDGIVTEDVAKRVSERMEEVVAKRPRLDDDHGANGFSP